VLFLHLLLAAEHILDREQAHIREVGGVLGRHVLVDGTIEMLGDDLLRFGV
jgi:hypothetical protein